MKPRVWSGIVYTLAKGGGEEPGTRRREWYVSFDDSCGCREEQHFINFRSALRFAYHVAMGGSRWEFVA